MKTTVVPAQVTTVEDKIAGNLTFSQLILLTTPVFLAGTIFAFLPPFMNLRGYKLVMVVLIATVCMSMAIRIKGRILLAWIGVLSKYNLRTRYFVFNKNDSYLREAIDNTPEPTAINVKTKAIKKTLQPISIPMNKLVWAEEVAHDPRAKLEFRTTKKGELRVHIQEIK
jgi:hypothetical protein